MSQVNEALKKVRVIEFELGELVGPEEVEDQLEELIGLGYSIASQSDNGEYLTYTLVLNQPYIKQNLFDSERNIMYLNSPEYNTQYSGGTGNKPLSTHSGTGISLH